jgi:hypothetical protein
MSEQFTLPLFDEPAPQGTPPATIICDDVLAWAQSYTGEKLGEQGQLRRQPWNDGELRGMDVVFPQGKKEITIFQRTTLFLDIVRHITPLRFIQLALRVKAWVGMPISTMDFEQEMVRGKVEVKEKSPDSVLGLIPNAFVREDRCHVLLKFIIDLPRFTILKLLNGFECYLLTDGWIAKVLMKLGAHFRTGFGCMGSAIHTVLWSCVGFTHINAKVPQSLPDGRLRYAKQGSDVLLSLPRLVHQFQVFILDVNRTTIQSLSLAIRPYRNIVFSEPVKHGWVGSLQQGCNLWRRFSFNDIPSIQVFITRLFKMASRDVILLHPFGYASCGTAKHLADLGRRFLFHMVQVRQLLSRWFVRYGLHSIGNMKLDDPLVDRASRYAVDSTYLFHRQLFNKVQSFNLFSRRHFHNTIISWTCV